MDIKKGERDDQKSRCDCHRCGNATKHTVLASITHSGCIEGPDISFWDAYDIVQCDGCESICFRHEHTDSESVDFHTGEADRTVRSYPEAKQEQSSGAAYITDEVYSMPGIVQTIYRETLGAIRGGLPVLAGIGIRAIVEAVCHDQRTSGGTLEKKIDDLVQKSLLTQKGSDILHGLRLIGNDAAHQIKAPSKKQVAAAMKVIDHLLIGAYVLPEEAKVLPAAKTKGKKTLE